MSPSEQRFSRAGSVAAVAALVIYVASTLIHPGTAPHETQAAFSDYASSRGWGLIHLAELLGVLLMCAAAIALAWRLRRNVAGVWATLAGAATVVFGGIYAVFIAVDGVALGALVDRWTAAGAEQGVLYETAFAIRQIEAGLFGVQWLVFGIAATLFAAAFFTSVETRERRTWLRGMGWLSVVAGVGAIAFGIAQVQDGFTETTMAFQTGLLPGIVWVGAVAVFLQRYPEGRPAADDVPRPHVEARHSRRPRATSGVAR